ncbi:MAG: imidazole glycerol phosphate synthase subunit HisH, partial [Porticoccaceae bacterium]
MSDFRSHIAVIDYGMGNLHSVGKALEHVCPG